MHRSHYRLVLGVLVAVTSLIVAGAAGGASKKSTSGSMTFGAEQEPPCLNGEGRQQEAVYGSRDAQQEGEVERREAGVGR
jgi:hypothetical protein